MLQSRRGLVVYQLVLILVAVAILIWLIFMLVNREQSVPVAAPVDSAVVDTAPIPVPTAPADTTDTAEADTVPR
jgi:hypothetical protein